MLMQKQQSSPSLKRNAIFNIIYQLVQIGVPIILIPILSGRLKTDGSGNYAFIHSIVMYFSYFAFLGVNYYGTRTIARVKHLGESTTVRHFWIIFFAKSLTSIVAIIGYLTFSFIYWQNQVVLFTQLFFLVANLLDVSWFFSGDENFKSLCLRNVLIKTLSLILIILFVHDQSDIGIYSLILGLAEVANQIFMWALLIKRKVLSRGCFIGIFWQDVFLALKGMFIFFIPQLLIELYTILNTTILGVVWGSSGSYSEVGVFDYANKIVSVLTTIAVSLGIVFLARLSSLSSENNDEEVKQKIKQSMYYALFISIPLVIGIIGTGHSFIKWFLTGDDWSKVGILLYFLPLKVIFVAISNTLGVQYLISTGKMKKYIISVAGGAVVCIALNIALVKPLGAIGSAIAVVVAEACVTLIQCLLVRKEINVLSILKELWKPAVAGAIMGGFLAVSYLFFYNSISMYVAALISSTKLIMIFADLIIIICAALIYFAVLLIFKEKTIVKIMRKTPIKEKHDKTIWSVTLMLVAAIVLSVGFYRSYNIKYDSDFAIQRRAACASLDSSNNRLIYHKENTKEGDTALSTIDKTAYQSILDEVNKGEKVGYLYHRNKALGSIDMISYKFYFFQCLDYGTTFKVNLRYCIDDNEFIRKNIDSLNICVSVYSHEHDDAPAVLINIDNSNNVLSDYFNNPRRDFISYDGSTQLWRDDDFKCEKKDNIIYKDNYYCTVSLFFASEKEEVISSTISDANIKQEVWILNG